MTDRKADKVDLNTASRDDLVAVPGIGDAGADAIVKHRRQHGRFKSVDDVVNVAGIGAATLETAKAHLIASTKGGDGGAGPKKAAEKPAETTRKAGEAGLDVVRRASESAAEGARATAAAAPEMAGRAAETAQRTGAAVAAGHEAFPASGVEGMEDFVRAGEILRDRTSEFSRLWMSFWSEQLTDGMATMRALAGCRTWHEALEVQSEFTRASVERAWSRTVQSAELTTDMMGSGFRLPPGVRPPGRSRAR